MILNANNLQLTRDLEFSRGGHTVEHLFRAISLFSAVAEPFKWTLKHAQKLCICEFDFSLNLQHACE